MKKIGLTLLVGLGCGFSSPVLGMSLNDHLKKAIDLGQFNRVLGIINNSQGRTIDLEVKTLISEKSSFSQEEKKMLLAQLSECNLGHISESRPLVTDIIKNTKGLNDHLAKAVNLVNAERIVDILRNTSGRPIDPQVLKPVFDGGNFDERSKTEILQEIISNPSIFFLLQY